VVTYQVVFTKEFEKEANENGADDFYGIYINKTHPELAKEIYRNVWGEQDCYPQNVVEGITRKKKCYNKINIVFGVRNYHYDWSF
jgi:hypothetical protein